MLQPHQQRVIEEQKKLQENLDKLSEFLNNGKSALLSQEDWDDLILQEESMDSYNEILKRRISRF